MAKHFAKILVYGAQSVGRAFVKAVRQEIDASRAAAQQHRANRLSKAKGHDLAVKGMTLHEAQQILNVKDLSNLAEIRANYEHLFRANEKAAGGSLYIQSKVFRAKERIDRELQSRLETAINQTQSATPSSPTPPPPSSPSPPPPATSPAAAAAATATATTAERATATKANRA
ncbi:PREDICTED: mitochondrial import inner membrane translocase subunit tim16 [Drosophila arizonae]|uniref:Mitochondrial import inner membrane translocase subunit tim16 n=1 Tax=Drosophila arizonae TaxID=7263 RepID=A0ABM1PS37_DROAR|nr:PREDICTED: mitochondrial import inner membrane translocase subunit tim16 [Drosophila arizonae]